MPLITIEVKHGDEVIMALESHVEILPEDVQKTARFMCDKLTKRFIAQREGEKIRETGRRRRAKKRKDRQQMAGGNGTGRTS